MGNKSKATVVNVITVGVIILVILFFLWPRGESVVPPIEPTPTPSISPTPTSPASSNTYGWSLTPNMTVVRGQSFQVSLISNYKVPNNSDLQLNCVFSLNGWTNVFSSFEVKFYGSNQFEAVVEDTNMIIKGNVVPEILNGNIPQTWIFKGTVLDVSPGVYQIYPFLSFSSVNGDLWGGSRFDEFFVKVI
jgi:hypothetical protein